MGLVQGKKLLFSVLQLCRKVGDDQALPEPIGLPLSAAQLEAAIKAAGGGYLSGPPEIEGGLGFAADMLARWALLGSAKDHGVAESADGHLGIMRSVWTKAVPMSALNSAHRRQEAAEEAAEQAGEEVLHVSRESIERSLLARALPERADTTVIFHAPTGQIFVGAPRRRALTLIKAIEELLEPALDWTPRVIAWGFERSGLDTEAAEALLRRELAGPRWLRRSVEGKPALLGPLALVHDGLRLASKEHGRLSASGMVAEAIERALAGTADAGDLQDELEPLRPVGLRLSLEDELSGLRLELSFDSGLDLKVATTTAPLDLADVKAAPGVVVEGAMRRAAARMVLEVGAATEAFTATEALWAAVDAKLNASVFLKSKPRLRLLGPVATSDLLDRAPALHERWSGDQRLIPTAPADEEAPAEEAPAEQAPAEQAPAEPAADADELAERRAQVAQARADGEAAWEGLVPYDSPPATLAGRALLAWREGWERAQRRHVVAEEAEPAAQARTAAQAPRRPRAELSVAELAAERHDLVMAMLTLDEATAEDIASRCQIDREPCVRSLANLVAKGLATRTGRGLYCANRTAWFRARGARDRAAGVPFDSEPSDVRGGDRDQWRQGWRDALLSVGPPAERTVGRACPPGGAR
jgi:hypothetical protein